MNEFINPEWIWENFDRRTKGCFACCWSKRGIKQPHPYERNYCELEDMIAVDYPNEDKLTCKDFRRKNETRGNSNQNNK